MSHDCHPGILCLTIPNYKESTKYEMITPKNSLAPRNFCDRQFERSFKEMDPPFPIILEFTMFRRRALLLYIQTGTLIYTLSHIVQREANKNRSTS